MEISSPSRIFHHDVLIVVGKRLNEGLAVFFRLVLELVRYLLYADVPAEFVIVLVSLHFQKINNSGKIGFRTDWELNGYRIAFEAFLHHVHNIVEVRAHNVHFIYIGHAGYLVLVRLTPNRFRLRLYAAFRAENGNSAVQHTQRALYFDGEVDVSRRINNIDPVSKPLGCSCSRSDGNAAFLLLLHPVHSRIAFMGLTKFMVASSVKENAFRGRGFACVDMCHNPNITVFADFMGSWHCLPPFPQYSR